MRPKMKSYSGVLPQSFDWTKRKPILLASERQFAPRTVSRAIDSILPADTTYHFEIEINHDASDLVLGTEASGSLMMERLTLKNGALIIYEC